MKIPFNLILRPLPTRKLLRLQENKKARRRSSESTVSTASLKDDDFSSLVASLEKFAAMREAKLDVCDDTRCCTIALCGFKLILTEEAPSICVRTQVSLVRPISNYRVMQLEEKEMMHVHYDQDQNVASLAQYLVSGDFLLDDEELLHNSLDNFVSATKGIPEREEVRQGAALTPKRSRQRRRHSI